MMEFELYAYNSDVCVYSILLWQTSGCTKSRCILCRLAGRLIVGWWTGPGRKPGMEVRFA